MDQTDEFAAGLWKAQQFPCTNDKRPGNPDLKSIQTVFFALAGVNVAAAHDFRLHVLFHLCLPVMRL